MTNTKIALNPLPWVLTAKGFELSIPVLRQAFSEIATTPFKAIHADPPAGLTPAQYRALLAEYGLVPAPGYYYAAFHEVPTDQIVEGAKHHAAVQAELGNTEVFIAADVGGIRMKRRAVGAEADPAVLAKVIDGLGAAAGRDHRRGCPPDATPPRRDRDRGRR
jgi:inosose dehydratase